MSFRQTLNRVFANKILAYAVGAAVVSAGGLIGLFGQPVVAAAVIGLGCGILWTTSQSKR